MTAPNDGGAKAYSYCIDCSGPNVIPCGPDKLTNGVRPHWTCADCGSCFGVRETPARAQPTEGE